MQQEFRNSHIHISQNSIENLPSNKSLNQQPPISSPSKNLKPKKYRRAKKTQLIECTVCLQSCNKGDMRMFAKCKHDLCFGCLNSYIESSIQNFKPVKCCRQDCPQILEIMSPHIRALPLPQQQKYYQILAFTNLSKDPSIKLCPTEGCEGFIDIAANPVACAICNIIFCKKCLMNFHQGDCDQNGVNFLQKEFLFRRCSKCRMVLQKNEGCNHMTCKCGHQFCYVCGDQWSQNHRCGHPPIHNMPIAPLNVPNIPSSNAINASIQPISVNSNNIINVQSRQRQRSQPNNVPCTIKYVLIILLCTFVSLVTLQFMIIVIVTVTYCILFICVEVVQFFVKAIPQGVRRFFNRCTCAQKVIGNIFLLLLCIGYQFCLIDRWLWRSLPEVGLLFPLSYRLKLCLTR